MLPTAKILNDMGVREMRIIRTTEVPRWTANAGDACLTIPEYYEKMLEFAHEYTGSGMKMDIDIWQFLRIYPNDRDYEIVPAACTGDTYRQTVPVCKGNRGMIAVTSSGEVVPCMQMSGYLTEHRIHFGNLHETALNEMIQSGTYLDMICATVGDLRKKTKKCADCLYFEQCTGGCRALGLLYSGERMDFSGEDITKCMFFENGWYEKIKQTLSDWKTPHAILPK